MATAARNLPAGIVSRRCRSGIADLNWHLAHACRGPAEEAEQGEARRVVVVKWVVRNTIGVRGAAEMPWVVDALLAEIEETQI